MKTLATLFLGLPLLVFLIEGDRMGRTVTAFAAKLIKLRDRAGWSQRTLACRTPLASVVHALLFLLNATSQGADWPQWRGPNRDGVWAESGILATFPAAGLDVRWRVPVGRGWASPVIAQGRVYLTDCQLMRLNAL